LLFKIKLEDNECNVAKKEILKFFLLSDYFPALSSKEYINNNIDEFWAKDNFLALTS
jgi:hypothetical protein